MVNRRAKAMAETMTKIAETPAIKKAQTKAAVMRDWWSQQSTDIDWSEAMPAIEKLIVKSGNEFNEQSDYLQFRAIGKKLGKIAGKTSAKKTTTKGSDFSDFAESVAGSGIDTATLAQAIEIVASCGTVDTAKDYADKWQKLVETCQGDTDKAQEIVALLN